MKRDEAALCDLLEVTRRVMRPAKDNGTFWCEGVNPIRMVEWALSELAEVEDEIKAVQSSVENHWTDAGDEDPHRVVVEAKRRVQDEVGDLIFDVIMLACVCERDFGAREFTLAGAAEHASAKVKRRCPYSFGVKAADGPCPDRATEEAAWGAVKTAEKASKAPGGEPMPPPPPTYDSVFQYVARRGLSGLVGVDAAYGLPALALAFGVGAVVGFRCGR